MAKIFKFWDKYLSLELIGAVGEVQTRHVFYPNTDFVATVAVHLLSHGVVECIRRLDILNSAEMHRLGEAWKIESHSRPGYNGWPKELTELQKLALEEARATMRVLHQKVYDVGRPIVDADLDAFLLAWSAVSHVPINTKE